MELKFTDVQELWVGRDLLDRSFLFTSFMMVAG